MNQIKPKIIEKELYQPIADFLSEQGYQINSEVLGCDITATKADELIIIEMKTSLNLTLIIQAVKRKDITDSVYVAVPGFRNRSYPKYWKGLCRVLKRLEIGLILIHFLKKKSTVEILFHPKEYKKKKAIKKRFAIINEIQNRYKNYNTGGSVRTKLMTAYRENAIQIACYLELRGPLTPATLRKLGTGEKTLSILNKNFYGWFERKARGIYAVTACGSDNLKLYPDLVNYYKSLLEEINV